MSLLLLFVWASAPIVVPKADFRFQGEANPTILTPKKRNIGEFSEIHRSVR